MEVNDVITICDCPECPCWFPAWPDQGETRCYDCVIGKHNRLEGEAA